MKISLNKLTVIVTLASLYLLPYAIFGGVLVIFTSFVLLMRMSQKNVYRLYLNRISLATCALLIPLFVSTVYNSIGFADFLLSVMFYGFPVLIYFLFRELEQEGFSYFIKVNNFFIFLQIPFLLFQFFTRDGSTDDWFSASMMGTSNTQIAAFVFFVNFLLYIYLSKISKSYRKYIFISAICALATNTFLMTFIMLVAYAVFVIINAKLKTKILAVFILPILVFSLFGITSTFAVHQTGSILAALELVFENPENLLLIGKLRGIYYSFGQLFLDAEHFFLGTGPGSMSSRLIFYKPNFDIGVTTSTSLDFLTPLNPSFKEFTRGLFLRSNLHRPWSNVTAFLLEGGVFFFLAYLYLLKAIYNTCKVSNESKLIFIFVLGCSFVYHPFDNIKMNSFLCMIMLLFQYFVIHEKNVKVLRDQGLIDNNV